MADYIKSVLVKIEEDRVVVIDGEEYLVVDRIPLQKANLPVERKPYTFTDGIQEMVIEILSKNPNLHSSEIRSIMGVEYGIQMTPANLSALCRRMKENGRLRVKGTTIKATWSVVKKR